MSTATPSDSAARVNALIDRYGATEAGVWLAICERAKTCHVLHRAVTQAQMPEFTRLSALGLAALYLSFEHAQRIDDQVAELMQSPQVQGILSRREGEGGQ